MQEGTWESRSGIEGGELGKRGFELIGSYILNLLLGNKFSMQLKALANPPHPIPLSGNKYSKYK